MLEVVDSKGFKCHEINKCSPHLVRVRELLEKGGREKGKICRRSTQKASSMLPTMMLQSTSMSSLTSEAVQSTALFRWQPYRCRQHLWIYVSALGWLDQLSSPYPWSSQDCPGVSGEYGRATMLEFLWKSLSWLCASKGCNFRRKKTIRHG